MQNIGHQGLEPHILDAGNVLRPLEIVRGPVFSAFSCVVDDCGEYVSIFLHEQQFVRTHDTIES